jgi:hypothetical protein
MRRMKSAMMKRILGVVGDVAMWRVIFGGFV